MDVENITNPEETCDEESPECRICRSGPENGRLIRPCRCMANVHSSCLQHWLETRPGGFPRNREGDVLTSQLICEVCKSSYSIRIESRMDWSRILSVRSLESYFECISLLLTLSLICTTSWLLWAAANAKERHVLMESWALLGAVGSCMALLAAAALAKVYQRWRRAQAYPLVVGA